MGQREYQLDKLDELDNLDNWTRDSLAKRCDAVFFWFVWVLPVCDEAGGELAFTH
jgi:hypothetical protein